MIFSGLIRLEEYAVNITVTHDLSLEMDCSRIAEMSKEDFNKARSICERLKKVADNRYDADISFGPMVLDIFNVAKRGGRVSDNQAIPCSI